MNGTTEVPTWLSGIPASWPLKRLKFSVKSEKNGVWGAEPDGGASDIPCIRVADFDRAHLVVTSAPTVRSVTSNERNGRVVQPGDLLIEKSGGGETQPVGVVVQYTGSEPVVCSNFVARIPCVETVNPRFFLYLHAALYSARVNTRSIKQTFGIQNLDTSAYFSEVVPFPDLQTQSVIADFLDRETAKADALIAKYERLIQLIEEKRVALVTQEVTKGLAPSAAMKNSGVDWIGEIPDNWRVLRNKVLFKERDERSSTGREELLSVSHLTGVTPRSEKSVTMFMAESLDGYKRCFKGDFVINTMWAWMGAMGIAPCDGIVSPSYNVYHIREADVLDTAYYDLLARTPSHVAKVMSVSTGIWESRLRLYPQEFFDIKTAIPPIAEQRAIVAHVHREMQRYEALAFRAGKAISLLNEHRSALITAAVTGQIDVRTYKTKDLEEVVA